MKLSLPLKLGIFVVLLFGAVLAACLLWTPLKIRYYAGNLVSDTPEKRISAVDALLKMRERGRKALISEFPDGETAAELLISVWPDINIPLEDEETVLSIAEPLEGDWKMDKHDVTLLHVAAARGYTELVKLLVWKDDNFDQAAIIQLEYASGGEHYIYICTPLFEAVMWGHKETADFLIRNGADIEMVDGLFSLSLLHWAAILGKTEMIRLLAVKHGMDVNKTDNNSMTPLHCAAWHGHADTVTLLIKLGAKVNIETYGNETPLDRAVSNKQAETITLLRAHGGKTWEELQKEEKRNE
ncbi:MAG: ankyrin repeat domain-containing protein [Planctomycetota bacterium]